MINNNYTIEGNTANFSEMYIQTEQDLTNILEDLRQQNVQDIKYSFIDFCPALNDRDLQEFSEFVTEPFKSPMVNHYTTEWGYDLYNNTTGKYNPVVAHLTGFTDKTGSSAADIDLKIQYENMDGSFEEAQLFQFSIYREAICYDSGEGYFVDLDGFAQAVKTALSLIDYMIAYYKQSK